MRRRFTVHRVAPGHVPSNRFAWWTAFLATIALIVLLNAVRADAAMVQPGGPVLPHLALLEPEEEAEDELGEEESGLEEFEECEGGEEEVEECVEEGGEAVDAGPPGCGLVRAHAKLALSSASTMLLTIRYTAAAPTTIAIEYRSRGPRGALHFDGERRRLTGTGTLHETEHLTRHQSAQAMAAHTFTVDLRPLRAPPYCDQELTAKRTARRPVWLN